MLYYWQIESTRCFSAGHIGDFTQKLEMKLQYEGFLEGSSDLSKQNAVVVYTRHRGGSKGEESHSRTTVCLQSPNNCWPYHLSLIRQAAKYADAGQDDGVSPNVPMNGAITVNGMFKDCELSTFLKDVRQETRVFFIPDCSTG